MYLPQFLEKILGWSPLKSGAGMLPMMGVFAAASFASGPLYTRLGPKVLPGVGAACLCLGTFLLSLPTASSGFGAFVPGMAVLGAGVGLFYSSVTTVAVTALDPSRSSLAGGIIYMAQIAGGAIGLGLTTTIFTTASTDAVQHSRLAGALRPGQFDDVQGILAGTNSGAHVVATLPARAADAVLAVVRHAFAAGMQWAFRIVALLAFIGLVVTVLRVGGSLLAMRRAPAEAPATS
jgi:hypothetical protein